MVPSAASASSLLARAERAWASGDGEAAMAFFGRAADLAEADGDLGIRVVAVLGLARGQQYNLTPGLLPVRLHAAYDATTEPGDRCPAGRGAGPLLGLRRRAAARQDRSRSRRCIWPTARTTRSCSPMRSTRR